MCLQSFLWLDLRFIPPPSLTISFSMSAIILSKDSPLQAGLQRSRYKKLTERFRQKGSHFMCATSSPMPNRQGLTKPFCQLANFLRHAQSPQLGLMRNSPCKEYLTVIIALSNVALLEVNM